MNLANKVVLITGAKGGLGNYVTNEFLAAGAKVVGTSRAIADSDFPNPNFFAIPGELVNSEGARAVVAAAIAKWGRIDTLVHLVGGFTGGTSVAETSDSDLEKMLDMNLRAAFQILKAVLPGMRAQGSGRVLAVGARTAIEPVATLGVYSASKAALVSLIRTIALENSDKKIAANVVLPGTMDTPANRAAMSGADPAKWVQPQQIASLLVHLATDLASNINGAVIPVYGADA